LICICSVWNYLTGNICSCSRSTVANAKTGRCISTLWQNYEILLSVFFFDETSATLIANKFSLAYCMCIIVYIKYLFYSIHYNSILMYCVWASWIFFFYELFHLWMKIKCRHERGKKLVNPSLHWKNEPGVIIWNYLIIVHLVVDYHTVILTNRLIEDS